MLPLDTSDTSRDVGFEGLEHCWMLEEGLRFAVPDHSGGDGW
jgi:hypothetical protein